MPSIASIPILPTSFEGSDDALPPSVRHSEWPVTDEAIVKIKDMLLSGELKPGRSAATREGVERSARLSCNSLREAVKALSLIRVLDVRRGDGTFVTSLEPHLLLEAMAFVVELHQDRSTLESFEVRRILRLLGRCDGDGTSHTSGSRTARGHARRRRAEHRSRTLSPTTSRSTG